MILETGIKVYNRLLKMCVDYVNKGWHTNYKLEDIAGIEISETFMFVHFDKEDYTKEAYPIGINLIFK